MHSPPSMALAFLIGTFSYFCVVSWYPSSVLAPSNTEYICGCANILHEITTSGTTFKDKNALLTGVGKGSIGMEILKGLLLGGAHVIITTSHYNRSTIKYYQSIYQTTTSMQLLGWILTTFYLLPLSLKMVMKLMDSTTSQS